MRLRPVIAILVTCALPALAVAPARAEVRAGSIQDPIDNQPSPPGLVVTEVTAAAVSYDRSAGVVTAAVTFNRSASEDGLSATLELDGLRGCAGSADEPVPLLTVRLDSTPRETAGGQLATQASAELNGVEGAAVAGEQISVDGHTVSATIGHPAFAGRDWRCVRGTTDDLEPDVFAFPFAGFEPEELTPASALAALHAELTRRYGTVWQRPGRWTVCPPQELSPRGPGQGDGPQALCEFRFRQGARWRHGSVLLSEQFGEIVVSFFSSRSFSKGMRRCPPLRSLRGERIVARRLRAGGWVGCGDGPAAMIRDLHRLRPGIRRVGFHGTNRAGFEDAVTFRCMLRARPGGRRSATCANALGDRFVYSFRRG